MNRTLVRARSAWVLVGLVSSACLGEQFDPAAGLREGGFEVISSGGLLRRFLVHAPTSIQGPGNPPLIIAFHGAGQTPDDLRQLTGLDDLAEQNRMVVAYPEAYRPTGGTWGVHPGSPVERVGVFDLLFVVDLIDFLAARFDIDRSRVYAVGYSNGGQFSHRVGCELAPLVAAIGSVAGQFINPVADRCFPADPVGSLSFHGTDDVILPFNGGESGGITLLSAPETLDRWAQADGCTGDVEITQLPDVANDATTVELRRYGSCSGGVDVELYVVNGGGHRWPGSEGSGGRLGRTTQDVSASELLVDFFLRHRR